MDRSWSIQLGDCALLIDAIESPVHLVYMDPPFFKGETFKLRSGEIAFEDRWSSMHQFVDYVVSRALLCFRKLVPGGSLVMHLDPTTSHHVKVAIDGAIDRKNFANEIEKHRVVTRLEFFPARELARREAAHMAEVRAVPHPVGGPVDGARCPDRCAVP